MPTFDFACDVCGTPRRAYRHTNKPPRFCSKECMSIGMAGKSYRSTRWPITPELHQAIEKVYKTDSGNGQVAALADRLGYPRWKLTRYAITQGWIAKQKKEPDWSDRELLILQHAAHLSTTRIQLRLKAAGFVRTETGIVLKRRRMRYLKNLNGMSSRQAAECLGVDDHFITRAIKYGKLIADHRGTARTEIQGGDMWFIKEKHLRTYIIENLNEIDIRKVDKHWFVDLLITGNK